MATSLASASVIRWRRGRDHRAYLTAHADALAALVELQAALNGHASTRKVQRRARAVLLAVGLLWEAATHVLE